MMSVVALVVHVVALLVRFGARSWVHARRTGTTSFSGSPRELALVGLGATLAGQSGMRAFWRIGVRSDERTELVTTGPFRLLRAYADYRRRVGRFLPAAGRT